VAAPIPHALNSRRFHRCFIWSSAPAINLVTH
jgi:hypothetical protein